MTWQLQEAKNKLSRVVETSLTEGPQIISRHGKNTAVLISYEEYENRFAPQSNLIELLMAAPKVELDITRSTGPDRATEFNIEDIL